MYDQDYCPKHGVVDVEETEVVQTRYGTQQVWYWSCGHVFAR